MSEQCLRQWSITTCHNGEYAFKDRSRRHQARENRSYQGKIGLQSNLIIHLIHMNHRPCAILQLTAAQNSCNHDMLHALPCNPMSCPNQTILMGNRHMQCKNINTKVAGTAKLSQILLLHYLICTNILSPLPSSLSISAMLSSGGAGGVSGKSCGEMPSKASR